MYKKLQEEYRIYSEAKKALQATEPKAIKLTNYKPAQDNRYEDGVEIVYVPGEKLAIIEVYKNNFNECIRFFPESIPDMITALQLFSDGTMDNLPKGWRVEVTE